MANPLVLFQSFFPEASDTIDHLASFSLDFVKAVCCVQHPLPAFLMMAPLGVIFPHSESTQFGGWLPHPGMSISFPLFLGIGSGMGIRPKVNHWDSNLRFLVKTVGEENLFYPAGVAELTECEYGVGDGHLPTPWGVTARERSQCEEGGRAGNAWWHHVAS